MDVGEVIQNGGLVVGGGLIVKIGDWLSSWWGSRNQKTEITPTPLPVNVEKPQKYVTVQEFNKHVEDNARDHENMFGRLNANDKLTSKLEGILEGIRDDLKAIKDKLFKTR